MSEAGPLVVQRDGELGVGMPDLEAVLVTVREKITRYGGQGIGEQGTKTSLTTMRPVVAYSRGRADWCTGTPWPPTEATTPRPARGGLRVVAASSPRAGTA